jgi:hypothetical protein
MSAGAIRVDEERGEQQPGQRTRERAGRGLAIAASVAVMAGVAAVAASVWVYTEMRQETLRLSTEIAQLRLSLDLYAQRDGATPGADTLGTIESRLLALEDASTREQPTALPSVETAPAAAGQGAAVATESDGDCLPSGMRLLVAAGDIYPICGVDTSIEVMTVSNGYITLTDGTTVPSGSAVPLVGTACMIGVTSNGDEAVTGFAEIRVSC